MEQDLLSEYFHRFKFNVFQADDNTERKKRTIKEKLKSAWNTDKSKVTTNRLIYVKYPKENSHSGHLTGEVNNSRICLSLKKMTKKVKVKFLV